MKRIERKESVAATNIEKICDKIISFRLWLLVLSLLITVFLGYRILSLKLYDDPNQWPPKEDPNVVLNEFLQEKFGGANRVVVQVKVKEGDIFNHKTLQKIKRMSDEIRLIYGVIPYCLYSLSDLKTKYMRGTEKFLHIRPLLHPLPNTPEEMEAVKYGVYHNPLIYGSLVSPDVKATVIVCDFRTGQEKGSKGLPKTDPVNIYKEIRNIVEKERDNDHIITFAGSPIIIGWVNSEGLSFIGIAFVCFFAVMTVILWFAFKSLKGMVLPMLLGLVVSIWAFGLQIIFGGEIIRSSSAFVVPFILIAATVCHAVQFLKRFFDEEYIKTPEEARPAIIASFKGLFLPMSLSLITDFTAFLVLACVPFENVSILGSVTAFGLASLVVCVCTIFVPLLSYFPGRVKVVAGKEDGKIVPSNIERVIGKMVEVLVRKTKIRWVIISSFGVVFLFSITILTRLEIGQDNTYAIHNFLTKSWKGNPIYEMEMEMKEEFGGIYALNILIETSKQGGLKNGEVLRRIDDFAKHLSKLPEVAGVMDLSVYVKLMNRFYHAEDDSYFKIPDNRRAIGEYIFQYSEGEPGSFESVIDWEMKRAPINIFVSSTKREVVEKVYNAAKDYANNHFNSEMARAKVGGGAIAIAKAFNDNIAKWLILTCLSSALASFLVVLLVFRSFIAGVFLLFPLLSGTIIFMMVMHFSGIEMNSNITTAMAMAMGVGIDAELYFLFRFREEFFKSGDFEGSLVAGFTKIRKALIFSHLALIFACWTLIPIPLYVGYVGYGMGMIVLICFFVSFTVPPFMYSVFRPRFLFLKKGVKQNGV